MYTHTALLEVEPGVFAADILSPFANERPCSIRRKGNKREVLGYLKRIIKRKDKEVSALGARQTVRTRTAKGVDRRAIEKDRPPQAEVEVAERKLGLKPGALYVRVAQLGWTWKEAMNTPRKSNGKGKRSG